MAPTYLKLVSDRSRGPAPPRFEPVQTPLLPIKDRTLALCTADGLDESLFVSLTENLHPTVILDFRTTPRFDFGSFNRRRAFELFQSLGTVYLDFQHSPRTASQEADAMAEALSAAALASHPESHTAAVLALVDPEVDFERAGVMAVQRLREQTKSPWELLLFGPIGRDDELRQLIFISHANPEDNEFVLWLQTQLTRLGYETWSDLTALKGGEVFWDSIEDVVRHKAVRVIAVISRKAIHKPNVLDEVSLAVSVERTQQIPGFVIPIRADDIPFSDLRANIARKNVLDFFSSGWASGLSHLAETLSRDRVPRVRQAENLSLGHWWSEQKPATLSVVQRTEALQSNQFRVTSLPHRIYTFSGLTALSGAHNAWLVPFKDQWLSFLSFDELHAAQVTDIRRESVLAASDLFAGHLPLTSMLSQPSRQRLLHRMLNKQWESFLLNRGLRLYQQTGQQPNPYIPDGLIPGNTAYFFDERQKQRRRLLVAHSTKRNLYWHLAPLGSFTTTSETLLNLKMRILFSEDGQDRWPSTERMRTMRRSFCRNWWNDRWRSLQQAWMAWLSEQRDEVTIHAGDGGKLSLSATPVTFDSPVGIDEIHAGGEEAVIESDDVAIDSPDNGDGWSELDAYVEADSTTADGALE